MIETTEEFEKQLHLLDPEQDEFVRQADELIENLSEDIRPDVFLSVFRFFEKNPEADCGAPGVLVHHTEDYFPNYIDALKASVRRSPSYNGVLMINRILNSKIDIQEREEYMTILRSVIDRETVSELVRNLAGRFVKRQIELRGEPAD